MQTSRFTYSQFLETMPDAALVIEPSGNIVLANTQAHTVFAYQPGRLPGHSLQTLVPNLNEQLGNFLISARTRPLGTGQILTAQRQNGHEFQADMMLKPIELDGAHFIVCVVRDVTQRLQAERALQQSRELFSQAFRSSPTAITITRLQDGRVIDVNEAWSQIFGYTRAEAVGRSSTELGITNQETRQKVIDVLRAQGRIRNLEAVIRTRTGEEREVFLSMETLNINGEACALTTLIDVTERKRIQQALRTTEQIYQNTLEGLLEGCQIIDFDWRYHFVNETAARQGKRAREELLGRTMMECYPGIEQTELFAALKRCMETRTSERMVNKFVYPDNSYGWFELSIQPAPNGICILSNEITERLLSEKRIETQLRQLAALRDIDIAITGTFDLHVSLNTVMLHTMAELGADATSILVLNQHNLMLTLAAGRGFRTRSPETARIRLGESFAGRAALERRIIQIHNRAEEQVEPHFAELWAAEGFVTYYGVPLIVKGQVVGVLEVFHRKPFEADEDWLRFLEILAGQTAIAVDNAQLFQNLQRSNVDLMLAYDATIEGWSRALDLRDKETEGHTLRVTEMTERLARAMGISEAEIVHIRRGALLHDIGKMGVPDSILLKPDKLTEEEWAIMRQHPQLAFEMLSPIAFLRPALDIPGCHHEKWDGTGYPRGLKGEQIPLAARLFAVVDVWDALRSDRSYQAAWPEEKVLAHIRSLSGTHFDPKAVEVFMKVLGEQTPVASSTESPPTP